MTARAGLKVASELAAFVERRALPGTGIEPEAIWPGAADIFARLAPVNAALRAKRDLRQVEIDGWLAHRAGEPIDQLEYLAFLKSIGYLVAQPAPFQVRTRNVDAEVATIAGPQLVVPVINARFEPNAANARGGSLYDALYGTDAIPQSRTPAKGYDPARGALVIEKAKALLDQAAPLASGTHATVPGY